MSLASNLTVGRPNHNLFHVLVILRLLVPHAPCIPKADFHKLGSFFGCRQFIGADIASVSTGPSKSPHRRAGGRGFGFGLPSHSRDKPILSVLHRTYCPWCR